LGKYAKEQGTREAVFQMILLLFNLFLLFQYVSLRISETITADQDIPREGCFSYCADHQNCKNCGVAALSKMYPEKECG
jgi:hypothetical protein